MVVHDHFLPYRRLDTVDHAFCNAHILRELQSLIEFDKEPWAEAMRDMLREAHLAVNKARQASAAALAPNELAAFVVVIGQPSGSASLSIASCPNWRQTPNREGAASDVPAIICSKG